MQFEPSDLYVNVLICSNGMRKTINFIVVILILIQSNQVTIAIGWNVFIKAALGLLSPRFLKARPETALEIIKKMKG